MLPRVAIFCSVVPGSPLAEVDLQDLGDELQCVAVWCNALQCVAVCCTCCSVLQCAAVCCSVLQCGV